MEWIFDRDAKEKLLSIDGIGNKTADVILVSFKGRKENFVIDTHMRRIAIRLGLVDKKAEYEEIQEALKSIFPWNKIKGREDKVVALFWLLAKNICRAVKPKCNDCILRQMCRYPTSTKNNKDSTSEG